MRSVSKNILELLADLFTYLRAFPENRVFLEAIAETGAMSAEDFSEEEVRLKIKNLSEEHESGNEKIFSYFSKKYNRLTEKTNVQEKDMKFLILGSFESSNLLNVSNSRLNYEYADSFQGLPKAILAQNLDRRRYSSVYFEKFFEDWGNQLGAELNSGFREWMKD